MAVITVEQGDRSAQWARRYPPLLALLGAVLLSALVLPSALNLPQTSPSTTLEFAPVPPSDDNPQLQNGNLSQLGLGRSSSIAASALGGNNAGGDLPDQGAALQGVGRTPSTKDCVAGKQTADPLAPPCVADFRGDNFGATYQGVTPDEVRILIYIQGNYQYLNTAKGTEVTPNNEYNDLAKDEGPDDFFSTRQLRVYQRYFNERFQSYKRFVHFYVYYSGNDDSPQARKAEAADNYSTIKPFAVISYAERNGDAYLQYMAQKGVLNFGSYAFKPASFFQRFPKLIWGYLPSLEQLADLYTSYICSKLVPYKTSFSGNPGENGQPRKLGLLYADDAGRPELKAMADLVRKQVGDCGGSFIIERSFPAATYDYDLSHLPNYAVQNMAAFKQAGVSTIIMPGGVETNQSKAAGQAQYFPEWLLLGDTQNDQNTRGQNQDQTVWDHAAVVSNITKFLPTRDQVCYQAYKETAPESPDADAQQSCPFYNDLRQLFTGIQVAGPRLGPTSMDKGFHAIPKVASSDPTVPGCFYNADDYTCVKDGIVEHYNSQKKSAEENNTGCWQMAEGGKRYIPGGWPPGDATAQWNRDTDECNGYSVTVFTENPPDPDNPPS